MSKKLEKLEAEFQGAHEKLREVELEFVKGFTERPVPDSWLHPLYDSIVDYTKKLAALVDQEIAEEEKPSSG